MQKISPFLWFENQAEEAVSFYISVFKNSKVGVVTRYDKAGAKVSGQKEGSAMTVPFEIEGMEFIALNGGPHFKINEAISFVINCKNQVEIDYYWKKLSAHPEAEQCGWLKDKFGVSWQVVPQNMGALMSNPDPKKAGKVMAAMLKMKKIDIAQLKKAAV